MIQKDVNEQLINILIAPAPENAKRHLVFWHDVDGSFRKDFEELAERGLDERPVSFVKAEEGNLFSLKHRILRLEPDRDFVVYTRTPRDFSEGGLVNNWLASTEFIAEHFQADKSSMLLSELNAAGSASKAISEFISFFNAASRKEQYLRKMPETTSPEDVKLGVLATLLKARYATVDCIVETYLASMVDGTDSGLRKELKKYAAVDTLESFMTTYLGFAGDIADRKALSSHLLLTAASATLPDEMLSGLEAHISKPHERFCLNIVRDWINGDHFREELYVLCREVETELNLATRFDGTSVDEIVDNDIFPCINESILLNLSTALATGADIAAETMAVCQRRKDLKWYKRVDCYFEVLSCAAQVEAFRREHASGFHAVDAKEVWKLYLGDWHRMDASYRRFCVAYDRCLVKTEDIPDNLRDSIDSLADWVERVYSNWYLSGCNSCWTNVSEKDWAEVGHSEGISQHREFYSGVVEKAFTDSKRIMVIISDALRYEVASDIATKLNRETIGECSISAMQAVFPSVTEFGMPSLLPHKEMSLEWETGEVYLDGMPTSGTKNREQILKRTKSSAAAVLSDDLKQGNRTARKALVGDAALVYVYHDKIDSTGEKPKLEHDVFKACEETIDEIVALVKIAVNDLKIGRVFITADHGFLYTRKALDEQDKVGKAGIGNADMKIHRRYVLSNEDISTDLLIKMDMNDIHGGEYYGLAARECIRIKRPGSGENYVHGGVSLQETCVPIITYSNKRIGSRGYASQEKAVMTLVSTNRRITSSMFHVDLFQKEPIGSKIIPAEYELVLTDGSGNAVSDVQKAHADMETTDERARVTRPMFTLRADREYSAKERYYLVCRDKETGDISWKEEFTIEIAFAPIDFGF